MTIQSRAWLFFQEIFISTTSGPFSFAYQDINLGTNSGIANVSYSTQMTAMANIYEEYRVRDVTLYVQPATGYSVDDKIKSSIFARVDVNSQPVGPSVANLQTLINAESTVNRTFLERSNVKLVKYRPICYSTGGSGASSRPILPNSIQWYNIDERGSHLWRGATVAPVLLDNTISPLSKSVVIWASVRLEFRSRRIDYGTLSITNPLLVNSAVTTPATRVNVPEQDSPASETSEEDEGLNRIT